METTTQGLEEETATPGSAAKLIGKSGGKLPFRLEISLEINRNSMLLRKNYSL